MILIGKDGEKKLENRPPDSLDLKEFFSAIDQMPQAEKELAAPAEPEPVPVAPAAPAKGSKPAKPGSKAPKPLED